MLVRMLRDWKRWRTGRILDVPDGQANVMLRRHICETVNEQAPADKDQSAGAARPRREARRGNS